MAKKRNLSDLVVACEWAACTFKGRTMEELCDHMSLHLKEHLGDGDAMEELGGWKNIAKRVCARACLYIYVCS